MFESNAATVSNPDIKQAIERIRGRYSSIFAIVSPPRCSSTAFARVFWEHSAVGFYCHEPFEVTYYQDQGVEQVLDKLEQPLDLAPIKRAQTQEAGGALVIKEMPYQVGPRFPMLTALADQPIIFLMRDPRLNIASRMAKKREVGDSPIFPAIESGWELLSRQIAWCRAEGIAHLLVDSRDYRNQPHEIFPQLFDRLGLDFDPGLLEWRTCPEVELDNLGGEHRHLYREVLASTGVRPDTVPIPDLESFPEENGWREHVARCVAIYEQLAGLDVRLRPAS